jgi:hypothetical protein
MKAYSWKGLVIGVATIMVLSMALSVIPAGLNAASAPAQAAAVAPSAPAPPSLAAAPTALPSAMPTPSSGHTPGTLNIYENAPAGGNTMDPAVAYDTVSYEPILNVYQTLINYNGSTTATFVPTLATCVPGTTQCVTDYGSNLTGFVGSEPIYWTFVIDSAAHFYDPATKKSWSVEPSDVVFSIARTLAFADIPYSGKQPGWILAQSLLPVGKPWDSGVHSPFNNTPADVLSSMLVNSSVYCPAAAMAHANGCVTFVANGGGTDWPYFLELIADNLGGSIVPCGWFTYQSAGIPGWTGTSAANGDGSCLLPNGHNSTNGVAWSSYITNLTAPKNATSWDSFEELAVNTPAIQPKVQWALVGSGPYYAGVIQGSGYELRVNPGYQQPSGCSGAGGLAKYTGYCDPAIGKYIGNVNVYWEPDDSFGVSQYQSGSADLAAIEAVHTTTLLQLKSEGRLNYQTVPTLSDFFTPINLAWSTSNYATDFPSQPVPNIASSFFTNIALREFLVHAYPYTTIENTINTVDGVQYSFNAGGPIPVGMGNYYPSNVSFPTGDPISNPLTVGSAAWWWAQATTLGSPYYDAQAAACTSGSPCTWAIAGLQGDPSGDLSIADWITQIESLTGGALKPYGGASFDLTFDQFLNSAFTSAYQGPLVSETGTGWAPDYPDPTDYIVPMASPDATYTATDAFSQQLGYGQPAVANNTSCGHSATTYADLIYWANQAQSPAAGTLNTTCQGVAYSVAVSWMNTAAGLPVGANRTLDYNLIEQITNALAMYVWDGQSNVVVSAAPWISLASLNTNPVIGGGGDQVWFQVHYQAFTSNVTFQESGLTAGTNWSATFGTNTLTSTTNKITFASIPNGSEPYLVGFQPGYNATPANGTLSVSGNVTQDVTFTPVVGPTYNVTVNETGLVSNTTWSVVVHNVGTLSTNASSIGFAVPNGTYNLTPGSVAGYNASPATNFTVDGAGVGVNVTYNNTLVPVYNVSFVATGLPAGKNWSVTLSSARAGAYTLTSNTSTITFAETAGSYTAVYTPPTGYVAGTGSSLVTVTGNTTVTVPLTLKADAFQLEFKETGLPAGTQWNVSIATLDLTVISKTTSLNYTLANGTYGWAESSISGYVTTTKTGSAVVNGAVTTVTIAYTAYTFAVTFFEGGLATGASWNVTVNSHVTTSTSSSLTVNLANGTWPYTVGAPAGYEPLAGTAGNITVKNATASTVLVFIPIPATYTVTFTESGVPAGQTWTVYFDGSKQSSAVASISFTKIPNGSWTYGIGSISGYAPTPNSGTVVVAGATATVTVTFGSNSTSSSSPSSSYLSKLAWEIIAALIVLLIIALAIAAYMAARRPPASPPPKGWSEQTPPPTTETTAPTTGTEPEPGDKS